MKWRSRPAAPRTHAGRWLRAMHLGQWELRDSLRSTLNNGQKTGGMTMSRLWSRQFSS
jgi:hypothetical protein